MTKGFILSTLVFVATLFGGIYYHDLKNMCVAQPLIAIAPIALLVAILSEAFEWCGKRRAVMRRID